MKLFSKIIILFFLIIPSFAFAGIQNDMLPSGNTIMGESSEIKGNGTSIIMTVLTEFKNIIFGLLATISIGVFIYLGYKLIIAQGKPDEFKKAMMGLVYAIVGLAIVPLAWAMVKLISSLQF